jgi:Metalloenzyme superfamily/Carbohydrate phosphorylase
MTSLRRKRNPASATAGLGRLASCFMDSLASVKVPAIGYGSRVNSKLLSLGGKCLVTANHGNCELMRNPDGSPNTAHTNLVHFIYVAADAAQFRVEDGILADVAPTLLFLLGLPQPVELIGRNLLVRCGKDKE